jgi:DNA-binding XRE family transcriptional regulator
MERPEDGDLPTLPKGARPLRAGRPLIEFLGLEDMTPEDLQAWRREQSLSQARLATLLGVDVMTVSRWERGLREIPPFLHLALRALESVLQS